VGHQIRYAYRRLVRRPVFTLTAVICLGLGIGANTLVFSLVDSLLFNPVPAVSTPSRIFALSLQSRSNGSLFLLSFPDLRDLGERTATLSRLAAFAPVQFTLPETNGDRRRATGLLVSPGYFDVLGVRLTLGRSFAGAADDRAVIISDRLWGDWFQRDPDVLGRTLVLGDASFTVIGVTPPRFEGTVLFVPADLWIPLDANRALIGIPDLERRSEKVLYVLGRLTDTATPAQVEAEAKTLGGRLTADLPESERTDVSLVTAPLVEAALGPQARRAAQSAGLILFAAVGLVLLLACLNVANLLLVWQAEARRDISVQMALGASRRTILGRFLTEALLLAIAGGALGLLLSTGVSQLAYSLLRPPMFSAATLVVDLDFRVLLFTLGLSLVTLLLFALGPSLRQTAVDPVVYLKEGSGSLMSDRGRQRLRRVLVVIQVGLSAGLLAATAILVRGLGALGEADLGFQPHQLMTVELDLDAVDPGTARSLGTRLADRVDAVPDVASTAVAGRLPLGTADVNVETVSAQNAGPAEKGRLLAFVEGVAGDYFSALGVPVLRGRTFAPGDQTPDTRVAVINQRLADRVWPGEDPIGRVFRSTEGPRSAGVEVIGVVANSKVLLPWERPRAVMYVPIAASDQRPVCLLIRTRGDRAPTASRIEDELRAAAPGVSVRATKPMEQVIGDALWAPRLGASLLGGFGLLGLGLAATGLYGLVAFSVSRRTREFALRLTLGADRWTVFRQAAGEGLWLGAIGIALGLILTALATPLIRRMPVVQSAFDLPGFLVAGVLLTATILIASALPALRACRVSAAQALREQ